MIAEIAEAALGLGLLAVSSPVWIPYTARLAASYKERLKKIQLQQDAQDSFVPIQQTRAEELSALVHRQEIAKNTAYAIQSEAALALTEATIEKALSSGDLNLARQGIQLALPAPSGAYADAPHPSPSRTQQEIHEALNAAPSRTQNPYFSGVQMANAPFHGNGSEFYLSLLRGASVAGNNGQQASSNAVDGGGVVEGELLGPEPVDAEPRPDTLQVSPSEHG